MANKRSDTSCKVITKKSLQQLELQSINHFVFDFDGTLVDSNKLKRDAFFDLALKLPNGLEAMQTIYENSVGDRWEIWAAWCKELKLPSQSYKKYVDSYSDLVDKRVTYASEKSGATRLLRTLQRNGKQATLSSATPMDSLQKIVSERGWSCYFEGVFGTPQTKLETLSSYVIPFSRSVSEVIVIGDGELDFQSSSQVGCLFLPVGDFYIPDCELDGPLAELDDLSNLFSN